MINHSPMLDALRRIKNVSPSDNKEPSKSPAKNVAESGHSELMSKVEFLSKRLDHLETLMGQNRKNKKGDQSYEPGNASNHAKSYGV